MTLRWNHRALRRSPGSSATTSRRPTCRRPSRGASLRGAVCTRAPLVTSGAPHTSLFLLDRPCHDENDLLASSASSKHAARPAPRRYYPAGLGRTADVVGPNNPNNPTIEGSFDVQYTMAVGANVPTTYWCVVVVAVPPPRSSAVGRRPSAVAARSASLTARGAVGCGAQKAERPRVKLSGVSNVHESVRLASARRPTAVATRYRPPRYAGRVA